MKLKTLTTSFVTSILVGCGGINQNTTVQPAPTQQAARQTNTPAPPKAFGFDSVSFPQDTCGDKLPDDTQAYPIELYPVFIEYSESNLQAVTSQFCRDAFKNFREKTGRDAIQVASLVGKERANQFKELMVSQLKSGEVGEPTVIEAKQAHTSSDTRLQTVDSIGKAAQLNPEQMQGLIYLINTVEVYRGRQVKINIVLPTYIPPGFKVDEFEVSHKPTYLQYSVSYRNSSNSCFYISGDTGRWGGPPKENRTVEVFSKAFGKILLDYIEFDKQKNPSHISFKQEAIVKNQTLYVFSSGVNKTKNCIDSIGLTEAIKVVESLQYLNP